MFGNKDKIFYEIQFWKGKLLINNAATIDIGKKIVKG